MTDKSFLESAQHEANGAKESLIHIEDKLRSEGFDKEADRLSKIIINLEIWQNR